jgi:hypothetical protein
MPVLRMEGVAQMEFEGNMDFKMIFTATDDLV